MSKVSYVQGWVEQRATYARKKRKESGMTNLNKARNARGYILITQ